jgi:hypothetical protein
MRRGVLAVVGAVGLLLGTDTVHAALSEPVDGMVYDDVLDLCWLQDASASGKLTWQAANAWAAGLDVGGHTDWRLARLSSTSPTQVVTLCDGTDENEEECRTSGNELGYLFFYNLPGDFPKMGDRAPFTNIQNDYWSGTESSSNNAWDFSTGNGWVGIVAKISEFYGWAVRQGQCQAPGELPPEPRPIPAIGLWGVALLSLLLMALARARLR